MTIKPIEVKVTIIGDTFSFSFTEEYTDYAQDLVECGNKFHKTNTPMTEENIYDYFAAGEFTDQEIEDLNGNHFLFGFLETLGQSNRFPEVLHTYQGELTYKVENIASETKDGL